MVKFHVEIDPALAPNFITGPDLLWCFLWTCLVLFIARHSTNRIRNEGLEHSISLVNLIYVSFSLQCSFSWLHYLEISSNLKILKMYQSLLHHVLSFCHKSSNFELECCGDLLESQTRKQKPRHFWWENQKMLFFLESKIMLSAGKSGFLNPSFITVLSLFFPWYFTILECLVEEQLFTDSKKLQQVIEVQTLSAHSLIYFILFLLFLGVKYPNFNFSFWTHADETLTLY